MSIQGVQPKLSAIIRPTAGKFEIVDRGGKFILKPNPLPYREVPANEALTMSMAASVGIEVPPHGLVPAVDGSWVYFVKRFDREGRKRRLHVEDFAQLSGATRDTKYDSSIEKVAALVEEYCTFPAIEKLVLARRLLFSFVTGNEDMHLKNFSIIVENDVVRLSPAYDLLNTSLVLGDPAEESALPLGGKKTKLSHKLWVDYFMSDRLQLRPTDIGRILADFESGMVSWVSLIVRSHLSEGAKQDYVLLVGERMKRLGLMHDAAGD